MAALELLRAAGLASLPQISIPTSTIGGTPVGGQDDLLMALAKPL